MNRVRYLLTFGAVLLLYGAASWNNAHQFAGDYEGRLPFSWAANPHIVALRFFQSLALLLACVGAISIASIIEPLVRGSNRDAISDRGSEWD